MIELVALSKRYGDTLAVDGLDLRVETGEVVALVGGSGCGKTTTLKLVNRLVEPSAGRVRIGGQDVAALPPHLLRRRIGYAFQAVGLFPHMSVAENVGVTPRLLGWPSERVARRVAELLALVELDAGSYAERRPAEPELLLLDEPFGALDPLTRDRLQQSFLAIRRALGVTALFVTHDMTEALIVADRVAVMRGGRLVQVDTPARLLRAPADAYVAELLATPRRQSEAFERLARGAPA